MFDDYTTKLLITYYGVIIPIVSLFGVIGNMFTLFILRRYKKILIRKLSTQKILIHFKFLSFDLGQTRSIPKTVAEKCANLVLCIVICAI